MRSRSVYLFHVAFAVLLLVVAAPASALDIVEILINNGLAPPNPANVIDDDTYDVVYVRNVGCPPGWPSGNPNDPCPSPGAATEVALLGLGRVEEAHAYDSSSITIGDGASWSALRSYDSSNITMSGWGGAGEWYAYDFSSITMSDGQITRMMTYGFSTATLSGGQAGILSAYDSSNITMSGGWTELLDAYDSSSITIVGSNFAVDGSPVPYGDLTALSGTLTGTLNSGEGIDSLFHQGGGLYTGAITLVPEPSTALLLTLGLIGVAISGRRRRA